ncbi:MAG TPA: SNF2-related protein [bacterium]|nr:SNF2-related protein [bacterium]
MEKFKIADIYAEHNITYGELVKRDDRWFIEKMNLEAILDFNMLIYSRIDSDHSQWIFNEGYAEVDLNYSEICVRFNWFLKMYPLKMSTEIKAELSEILIKKLTERHESLLLYINPEPKIKLNVQSKIPLRKYQIFGIEAVCRNKRFMICDEFGLGKTAVGISSLLHIAAYPALFVTQGNLTLNFIYEFNKFYDSVCVDKTGLFYNFDSAKKIPADNKKNISIHNISGNIPYTLPEAQIYVSEYSILYEWTDILKSMNFKFIIFDECQELEHWTKNRIKTAKLLAGNSEYCLGLASGKLYDNLTDFSNIMYCLAPGVLGGLFDSDFHKKKWKEFLDFEKKNIKPIGEMLNEKSIILRRTREEVKQELPIVQYSVEFVEQNYNIFNNSKQELIKLSKKLSFEKNIDNNQKNTNEFRNTLRRITGFAKAKVIAERVKQIIDGGETVILIGDNKEILDLWNKDAFNDVYKISITDSNKIEEKNQIIQKFYNERYSLIIISSVIGVNFETMLQKNSVIIFGDIDWTQDLHYQIIEELNNLKEDKRTQVLYLLCQAGSDMLTEEILNIREKVLQSSANSNIKYNSELASETGEIKIRKYAEQFLAENVADIVTSKSEYFRSYEKILEFIDEILPQIKDIEDKKQINIAEKIKEKFIEKYSKIEIKVWDDPYFARQYAMYIIDKIAVLITLKESTNLARNRDLKKILKSASINEIIVFSDKEIEIDQKTTKKTVRFLKI